MPGYELIGEDEKRATQKIFDEGGILFHRAFEDVRKKFYVREFNNECEQYFKNKNCSAVSSGTAAVKCSLKAIGIKAGDEVITQAFNFVACVEAIVDVGAKPVICNVDKNLHLDMADLKSRVTKKTKAVLIVHMLGLGGPMKELKDFCLKNNLIVLEDACEAIGGSYEGEYYGSIGDIGMFSFDFAKMITCGEGGLTLTNNNSYGTYIKQYIDHGHENNPNLERGHDNRVMPGFNFRMTEIQASIASVQLGKLKFLVSESKKRYLILKEKLEKVCNIREELNGHSGSYDTFIFFNENQDQRSKIIKIMKDLGFGTKILPDALEWHCSSFWGHAMDQSEVNHSKPTLELLNRAIGIPILVKKEIGSYQILAEEIIKIIN